MRVSMPSQLGHVIYDANRQNWKNDDTDTINLLRSLKNDVLGVSIATAMHKGGVDKLRMLSDA